METLAIVAIFSTFLIALVGIGVLIDGIYRRK
jgi:hypothetical protein